MFSSFTDDLTPADLQFAIRGSSKGCVMQLKQSEDINMSMNYKNDYISVEFDSADKVVFDPSGYVEVSGSESDYDVSIISNAGHSTTDWYEMDASGTAGSVTFYKADGGYILQSDSLQNVILSAVSDSASPSLKFSTEQSEVFIYEIDENTIGVAVDTDGDGIYETPIATFPAFTLGDLDDSGKIDIVDVIKLNKFLLGSATLSGIEKSAADVDGNGEVDSTDSLIVLKYVVELIASFSAA